MGFWQSRLGEIEFETEGRRGEGEKTDNKIRVGRGNDFNARVSGVVIWQKLWQ